MFFYVYPAFFNNYHHICGNKELLEDVLRCNLVDIPICNRIKPNVDSLKVVTKEPIQTIVEIKFALKVVVLASLWDRTWELSVLAQWDNQSSISSNQFNTCKLNNKWWWVADSLNSNNNHNSRFPFKKLTSIRLYQYLKVSQLKIHTTRTKSELLSTTSSKDLRVIKLQRLLVCWLTWISMKSSWSSRAMISYVWEWTRQMLSSHNKWLTCNNE